jgi:hypothetical protein
MTSACEGMAKERRPALVIERYVTCDSFQNRSE